MNPILQYLSDPDFSKVEINSKTFKNSNLEHVNSLFANSNQNLKEKGTDLKKDISIEVDQLWTVKSQYNDFFGFLNKAPYPYIVSICSPVYTFESEEFVRVQVISQFTEMRGDSDVLISNESLLGFPFIIESWNERPIHVGILNNYIGNHKKDFSHKASQLDSSLFKTYSLFTNDSNQNTIKPNFGDGQNYLLREVLKNFSSITHILNAFVSNNVSAKDIRNMIGVVSIENDTVKLPKKSNSKSHQLSADDSYDGGSYYSDDTFAILRGSTAVKSKKKTQSDLFEKYIHFLKETKSNSIDLTSVSQAFIQYLQQTNLKDDIYEIFLKYYLSSNSFLDSLNKVIESNSSNSSLFNVYKSISNSVALRDKISFTKDEIREFRRLEIKNARYLSNSALSYIWAKEN